ncbi:hypothetical protein ON010_g11946 [Phytophthora cinnamomi]|nr:hypothetical protein ON010_g11946 [Phytophthora cinnamomi]
MSRLTCADTRFYAILLCLLDGVLVSSEIAPALVEPKVFPQDLEPRRLLRSHQTTGLRESDEEDRAIKDLSMSLKIWAKNTHLVKNWELKVDTKKVEKTNELYRQGVSYQVYLKANITPEQLYRISI